MKLLADLQSRGLLAQASDPHLDARLAALAAKGPIAAYAGFDPTSDSLHVGNFIAILGLMHAQRNGIRPIALVGGATGLIGDPSGKTAERQLLTKDQVAQHAAGIRAVLERFLDFKHPTAPAAIVNNLDWFGPMSAIDFLRDVGKHFRIGNMLAKDSVKSRMGASDSGGSGDSGGEGMSYTEFSYQLLQGYDFYKLYKQHHCVLQLGGSDQWGNITAGIDLIRKLAPGTPGHPGIPSTPSEPGRPGPGIPGSGEPDSGGGHAFGVTLPLITTSGGQKFGKSEGNAVWLSAEKTSPYDFYQFWLRVEDADAERYLNYFTFLPPEEISDLAAQLKREPEKRAAQKRLAEVMTELVHGRAAVDQAQSASAAMYGGDLGPGVDEKTLATMFAQVPTTEVPRSKISGGGWPVLDAMVETGLAKSKGDARRMIAQGGFYVNNQPWTDPNAPLTESQLLAGTTIVLRTGKKNYRLARVSRVG